jgi:hypothetical protein
MRDGLELEQGEVVGKFRRILEILCNGEPGEDARLSIG